MKGMSTTNHNRKPPPEAAEVVPDAEG